MKVLLVFPYYPPDKGVSTFRAVSFFTTLSKDHVVKVLKPGDSNDLSLTQTVSTLDSRFIKAVATAIFFRKRLNNLLKKYLKQFDCVIVSVPIFSLCVVALIARKMGIPTIIDIRDHPDLIYHEMIQGKNQLNKLIRWLMWRGTEALLTAAVNSSDAVMCVGIRSGEYQKEKTPKHEAKISIVHNGFEENDWQIVEKLRGVDISKKQNRVSIGIAGSIHRFRDTVTLRNALRCLNETAASIPMQIEHWGILSLELSEYVAAFKNLSYIKHGMIARQEYLRQIIQCDVVLLVCSDSLIWEPTTTVFDYLLLGKPIVFIGNKHNEAYRILKECEATILFPEDLTKDLLQNIYRKSWKPKKELVLGYSRENQNRQMIKIVETLNISCQRN